MMRTHTCGELNKSDVGAGVKLCGWVDSWRDHGGVIFIDLRDRWGITQVVFNPENGKELLDAASKLRSEFCIGVSGKVSLRPEGTENPKISTGEIEVAAESLKIYNRSKVPPIDVSGDSFVSEDIRLKYRFLDLRRGQMASNIETRYKITKIVRDYLDKNGFLEIETPYLTKSTPEGARDYLVPARLAPGHFYALPQSPQLFKQTLMVAGFDRYFQIVRCFRDEDLRADRQPEHTQIDMELSFVEEEDIYSVVEGMVAEVFKGVLGIELERPFMRISYDEAMNRYGSDKPDLRFGLEIEDVTDIFRKSEFKVFANVIESGGVVKGLNAKGMNSFSRKDIDDLTSFAKEHGVNGLAWLKYTENGFESPIKKFFSDDVLERIAGAFSAEAGDILFFVADKWNVVCGALGALRKRLAELGGLVSPGVYKICWVTDFPLLEYSEDDKRFYAMHHPFTSPKVSSAEEITGDPAFLKARAYDLVLNGTEVGGGSIRIHDKEIQRKIFELLNISDEEAEEKFDFLLSALSYGAPPHGGIALGLDRLTAMVLQLNSIRDVIPFPKTQKGTCPLTGAPSTVSKEQLRELRLKVKE